MKRIAYFFLIMLLVFLSGCTSLNTNESADRKIAELQSQIENYKATIDEQEDEIESHKMVLSNYAEQRDNCLKFIHSSIIYLDDKELSILAREEWSYSIDIDDKHVQSDTNFGIDKNNFKITYAERTTGLSTMVPEIFERGKISGDFYEHLEFINVKPSKTNMTDGTVVQAMTYDFENVQKGTIIKLQVSDELKERLDIEGNIVSIEVN